MHGFAVFDIVALKNMHCAQTMNLISSKLFNLLQFLYFGLKMSAILENSTKLPSRPYFQIYFSHVFGLDVFPCIS